MLELHEITYGSVLLRLLLAKPTRRASNLYVGLPWSGYRHDDQSICYTVSRHR